MHPEITGTRFADPEIVILHGQYDNITIIEIIQCNPATYSSCNLCTTTSTTTSYSLVFHSVEHPPLICLSPTCDKVCHGTPFDPAPGDGGHTQPQLPTPVHVAREELQEQLLSTRCCVGLSFPAEYMGVFVHVCT
jgi:hypothetical protein